MEREQRKRARLSPLHQNFVAPLSFLADAVESLVTAADILGFRPQHLYHEALQIHARPIPRQVYGVGSSMALFLGTYKLFNYGMVPSEALRRLNGYLSGVLECISGEANPEGISITGLGVLTL